MPDSIDLRGRVAIVTGAGNGIGREHALLLARRGARVVVNDLGGGLDGEGKSSGAAQAVAAEIVADGGEAIASGADVTRIAEVQAMADEAAAAWGRVDILVSNAGILRDKSFLNARLEDLRAVIDVHMWGAINCTKAVWSGMRERKFGRILFTTSSSGLYGNFGQSAYSAAKMALVGLMNTLHLEGERYGIRVNCLAPSAATRMTDGVIDDDTLAALSPAAISPGMLALVCDEAPSRTILCAGAGSFEAAHVTLTRGRYIGGGEDAPERVLGALQAIADRRDDMVPGHGRFQSEYEAGARRPFPPSLRDAG